MKSSLSKGIQIESIVDISFFAFLITEFGYKHSSIGQSGIIVFAISTLLLVYKKKRIAISYYFIISIIFILYNYLNAKTGFSINPNTSLKMINTLVTNFFILFIAFNYFVLRNDTKKVLSIIINATLLFSAIVALRSLPYIFNKRLGSALGINANTLAIISGFALILAYYRYTLTKKKLDLVIIIYMLLIVLLTGSRKGLFVSILGPILLLLLQFKRRRIKYLIIGAIITSTILILIMYIPALYSIIGFRIEAIINYILNDSTEEASLRTRMSFVKLGWQYFKKEPWRGIGIDTFRHLPGSYKTYSHNNFIEILVSGGIIGFTLYYLNYLIVLLKGLYVSRKCSGLSSLCLSLVIMILFLDYGMVSYYDRYILIILMFCITQIHCKQKY